MIRQARNLQDSTLRPKYRRRNVKQLINQITVHSFLFFAET